MSDLPLNDPDALLAALKGEDTRTDTTAAEDIAKQETSQVSDHVGSDKRVDTGEAVPHPADTAPVLPLRRRQPPALVPPFDQPAEEIVLGTMMVDARKAEALFDVIAVDDFYLDPHRLIAQAILSLLREGAPTDPVAVYRRLNAMSAPDAGSRAYLATLYAQAVTISEALYHARALVELSSKRALMEAMSRTLEGAANGKGADDLLGALTAELSVVERAREPRIRLYSIAELRELPAPVDLIEGVISRDVLVTLWGPSGHGKSLLALDMALSVALGRPWFGRKVQQGPVVMVVAEGVSATAQRVDAWLSHRGEAEPAEFHIVSEAINLFREEDPQAFVRAVARVGVTPALVVFDTLARSMVGADENSARDLGIVIAAADWIRSHSGATVLVVHHSGRSAEHERGSTALFGASDTVMSAIKNEDGAIVVASRKQKDRVDFKEIGLAIQPVDNSVVLVETDVADNADLPPQSATAILAALWQSFGSKPVSGSKWLAVAGTSERTYYRARKWLVDHGFVDESGTDKRPIFTISERGEEMMTE